MLRVVVTAMALSIGGVPVLASADEVTPGPPSAACGTGVPMESNAPRQAAVPEGAYFSFPNTTPADSTAIRDQVLATIESTNGTYCTVLGPDPSGGGSGPEDVYGTRHGSIKITSWSWNDWEITNALIAARDRGVSVQVIAARGINENMLYRPWIAPEGARQQLGYHRGPVPVSLLDDEHTWAHDCAGACRGPRGAAHWKYFLFDDVRSPSHGEHLRHVVMQSSANLTQFAIEGQWNQADARYDELTYADFVENFYEAAQELRNGYARHRRNDVTNTFFPKGAGADPAAEFLRSVSCAGGTPVRVVNYAFYDTRGVSLARQLRTLWSRGCEVKVIYAIGSRAVLRVLRARGRPGPIPVKQSVIRNHRGRVVQYNHSKWVSAGDRVLSGSGNWSNNSFNDDEQFLEFAGADPFRAAFDKTWEQSSSRAPRRGGRLAANLRAVPEQPLWGHGELRFLTPEG